MILVKTIAGLQHTLARLANNRQAIGFVPTMGALHAGHISLVKRAKAATKICVASIFINPTQFNNKTDFEKYPVTIEKDIDMLEAAGCDVLFMPGVAEMYPPGEAVHHYDLGYLETTLEGAYRPGHFQGVCRIVDKLLDAVRPGTIFMGSKDYQQCMVIKKLIELKNHDTVLSVQPTVREDDGLAMSSRNMRLSEEQRKKALAISKCLFFIKDNIKPGYVNDLADRMAVLLDDDGFKTDYIAIRDADTLEPVADWNGQTKLVALAAAYLGEVRLIDNMII